MVDLPRKIPTSTFQTIRRLIIQDIARILFLPIFLSSKDKATYPFDCAAEEMQFYVAFCSFCSGIKVAKRKKEKRGKRKGRPRATVAENTIISMEQCLHSGTHPRNFSNVFGVRVDSMQAPMHR